MPREPRVPRPQEVDAVVLAGSYQWTGSPFDELLPRPLLPVAQAPIIEYVLDWLSTGGITRGAICANGATSAIRAHLERSRRAESMELHFHKDEQPRGAAGCVKDAALLLSARTLVVADGASIPTVDLPALLAHHYRTNAEMTIVAHEHSGAASALCPVGVYVLEAELLDLVPSTSFQDLKENLIPKLYSSGHRLEVFRAADVSPRVLNASGYLALNHWLLERLPAADAAAPDRAGRSWIDPTANISPDALLVGPVMVGVNVRVEAGATLVGPCVIGDHTVVERGAVVARSVVWQHCRIGARSIVDQSVLGDGSVTAPDVQLFNAVRLRRADSPFAWSSIRARSAKLLALAGLGRGRSTKLTERVV